MNRRKFIKTGLRSVITGSLIFGGSILVWRGKHGSGRKQDCPLSVPCSQCWQISKCTIPNALEIKKNLKNDPVKKVGSKNE